MREKAAILEVEEGFVHYTLVFSLNSVTAETSHMLEWDLAVVTRAVCWNGSVLDF